MKAEVAEQRRTGSLDAAKESSPVKAFRVWIVFGLQYT